jgi:phosphotransferase system enzyme I (PtsI)
MQPGSLLIAKELLLQLDAAKLARQTRKLMKHLGEQDFEQQLLNICTRR